ncbi:MAG: AraC family transcriptional regulator [Marinomonas sp.]
MKDTIEIQSFAPSTTLAPFVESFWMIQNHGDRNEEVITFPDGGIDLYFFHNKEFSLHTSLVGLETHSQLGSMPKHSKLFGVRLKLLAAEYLLNSSVAEWVNNKTTLPHNFAGICENDLRNFDFFCEKLAHYLSSQLTQSPDSRKLIMSELLYASHGAISVSEVSAKSHWSSRQINRYFNKWLGLPLKTYCDILRFSNSFESLKMGLLFPEEGFTDQSHYIKLIKKYSNLTPKQLAQGKNDRFIQLSTVK